MYQKKVYNISGMSCASCQARVEKAVSALPSVSNCAVSLLTNSMTVEGNYKDDEVISAVKSAGYGASVRTEGAWQSDGFSDEKKEIRRIRNRLIFSIGFLAILVYVSMGADVLGLPVPSFLETANIMLIMQGILALTVMIINHSFFVSGGKAILHLAPNMDTLVAMGSATAFVYSVIQTCIIIDKGDGGTLYYSTAAMIPCLISVGKLLEAVSKGKTTDALKNLVRMAPMAANVITDGAESVVSIENVKCNDICVVYPGGKIPVDGEVIWGSGTVDESAFTGESIPVDKTVGDSVSAATINLSGNMHVRATAVGEDTSLAQIIKIISDSAATKAPIARIADRVSLVFVPVVIGVALITFLAWVLVGKEIAFAISRAIAVLVISCPCALGLATPVAIMAGCGVGAKYGILFKTAAAMEKVGRTKTLVLDKTGTITKGNLTVVGSDISEHDHELISILCSLEKKSEHPVAKAVARYCMDMGGENLLISDFESHAGHGVSGKYNGVDVFAGSVNYIEKVCGLKLSCNDSGATMVILAIGREVAASISLADEIKEDSQEAIRQAKGMGIRTLMLTGDNAKAAANVARLCNIEDYSAELPPVRKSSQVAMQKQYGLVSMVGDGINDAPALAVADIGIAIGSGTDVAIDAADIVVMKSSLLDVMAAIRLSRATIANIYENFFWAFIYNIICIPLAAGFYQAIFGFEWQMNPIIGAACMCLSSFTVCMNALRLNLKKIYNPDKDKKKKYKEKKRMVKTIKIEGMMCTHCEATVKKALESIDGVTDASVSHVSGTAVVSLEKSVSDEELKRAIEDRDFHFISIE